ncbi:MAG: OmpA family protein, partial [Pseudomonadota bacterium]|nr:OmpA family protein [Pseudomonadota bacterium]
SLPDYANPVSWYERAADKVGGWFSDDGADQTSDAGGFPALKKAPPPRAVTSGAERDKIVKGLVADRKNARHLASGGKEARSNLWPNKKLAASAAAPAVTKAPAPKVSAPKAAAPKAAASAPQAVAAAPKAAASAPQAVAAAPAPQATPAPKSVAATPAGNLAPKPQLRPSTGTEGSAAASETPQFRLPASAANQSVVVHFANGSSRLSANDRADVAKIAKLVREKGARVRVVGHASRRTRDMDPVRHMLVNFEMSVKRANAVAAELARRGVDRDVIRVEARGASEPLFLEVMPAGEAGNRRAEIFVDFTS